jgi:hypothetical protein
VTKFVEKNSSGNEPGIGYLEPGYKLQEAMYLVQEHPELYLPL